MSCHADKLCFGHVGLFNSLVHLLNFCLVCLLLIMQKLAAQAGVYSGV